MNEMIFRRGLDLGSGWWLDLLKRPNTYVVFRLRKYRGDMCYAIVPCVAYAGQAGQCYRTTAWAN